ncbi:MAG: hypothetical protein A2W90_03835 [Bacteroidetes bacterium GWF2_42_66]|nr:MAG: hypothetical protein A2W92_18755 [Bacteroidetes bacterium GWA2_42_15]OFY02543.1 MAG: hypothetical protein A2W89_22015 [Bacteroidetes bacterium GWE2_42_39]OFY41358.1 MAG: hypothetical protein A2W90_03835 [Bacteroidetes bacterium GWF2_42_66]HBL75441.1 hypothetical protein [Prolixibacteraceae bacterium]HCR91454.1 hypothetical protein [Prolixibacteraceae bacterium]
MDLSELFKKVLIKDDQYVLSTNSSQTIVYQECFKNKLLNKKQIRKIHDLIEENQYVACVIKVNEGNLIPYEDETWVEKLNLPVLYDAGILFIAYISQNNVFSNLEIEKEITNDASKKIKIRIFKNEEEAIKWLKSVNATK